MPGRIPIRDIVRFSQRERGRPRDGAVDVALYGNLQNQCLDVYVNRVPENIVTPTEQIQRDFDTYNGIAARTNRRHVREMYFHSMLYTDDSISELSTDSFWEQREVRRDGNLTTAASRGRQENDRRSRDPITQYNGRWDVVMTYASPFQQYGSDCSTENSEQQQYVAVTGREVMIAMAHLQRQAEIQAAMASVQQDDRYPVGWQDRVAALANNVERLERRSLNTTNASTRSRGGTDPSRMLLNSHDSEGRHTYQRGLQNPINTRAEQSRVLPNSRDGRHTHGTSLANTPNTGAQRSRLLPNSTDGRYLYGYNRGFASMINAGTGQPQLIFPNPHMHEQLSPAEAARRAEVARYRSRMPMPDFRAAAAALTRNRPR